MKLKKQNSVRNGIKGLLLATMCFPARAAESPNGWQLNFTPALVGPVDGYGWGGGLDPELRYTRGSGVHLSLGARAGGYYATDQFGIVAMPTVRLTIPIGALEAYGAYGVGYGNLPKARHSDYANMYRAGLVIHFSRKFRLGIEGTRQEIIHSRFRFFSMGSMISIRL